MTNSSSVLGRSTSKTLPSKPSKCLTPLPRVPRGAGHLTRVHCSFKVKADRLVEEWDHDDGYSNAKNLKENLLPKQKKTKGANRSVEVRSVRGAVESSGYHFTRMRKTVMVSIRIL